MEKHGFIPAISVVMPVYNMERYVKDAVESILNQTFWSFELIIVDDGSTDATRSVLQSISDPRIVLITESVNRGNYPARNKGCRRARGKYICVMDADDIALPNRLKIQFDYMESHPSVLASGGSYQVIGYKKIIGHPLNYEEIRYAFVAAFSMLHPTIIFRKKIAEELNFYDEKYPYASDYDLMTRMALKGVVCNVSDVLVCRRNHQEQISVLYKQQQGEYAQQIQFRYQQAIGMKKPSGEPNSFLSMLAVYLRSVVSYIQSRGLFYGRLGLILFFYKYGRQFNKEEYIHYADSLLNELFSHLYKEMPLSLDAGIYGVGIAVNYLLAHDFVKGDPDEVLKEIDIYLESKLPLEPTDYSFESGVIGIVYYVVSCFAVRREKTDKQPFSDAYLQRLGKIILKMEKREREKYNFITEQYRKCLAGEVIEMDWNELLDRIIYPLPKGEAIGQWLFGLRTGCAGLGIYYLKRCEQ